MTFILEKCTFCELTEDIINTCQFFSCGNNDLDDFFRHDAVQYARFLMGKTYCFRLIDNPSIIVGAFTLSNDSIRIYDLPRSRKDHMKSLTHHEKPLRRYPGVLIGRLGVNKMYTRLGVGSEILDFIKGWFFSSFNKTGCRFVIVDAVNDMKVLAFYQKNSFQTLFSSEEQELVYTLGNKDINTVLDTRLMYFDLLNLKQK